MTDFPILDGALEIRARGEGRSLFGRFAYGSTATIRSSGTVRKERFAPDSMSWQTRRFAELNDELAKVVDRAMDRARVEALQEELERRNTHLLVGHSYDKAIADTRTGNLKIRHTRAAVEIEAKLPPESPSTVLDQRRGARRRRRPASRDLPGLSGSGRQGRGAACAGGRQPRRDDPRNHRRRGLRVFPRCEAGLRKHDGRRPGG